jgi:hypothetical protein
MTTNTRARAAQDEPTDTSDIETRDAHPAKLCDRIDRLSAAMYRAVQSHDRGPHHREFRAAGWDGRSQDLGHQATNARLVLV